MMVECTVDLSNMKKGELHYGASASFSMEAALGVEMIRRAMLAALIKTIEEMDGAARPGDFCGIDTKKITLGVRSGRRSASLSIDFDIFGNPDDAKDCILRWIDGDAIGGVVE
jgi:hypothetical protein